MCKSFFFCGPHRTFKLKQCTIKTIKNVIQNFIICLKKTSKNWIADIFIYFYHRPIMLLIINKIKKQNIPHSRNNIKIVERGKTDTSNTKIHDRLFSWLGTGTSIKNGRVKLVLWTQTSILVKWHSHALVLSTCE